jgi:hypothetical protein
LGVEALFKLAFTVEVINVDTTVTIDQAVTSTPDDAAEASAMADQVNTGNQDCGNCAEKTDTIDGSGLNDVGIVSINQAGGNANNQGTIVSAAVDVDTGSSSGSSGGGSSSGSTGGNPGGPAGFAHAQAEATQINGSIPGGETNGNNVQAVDLLFRNALITNSFNSDTGLVYANQATGNNNNQLNMLALAFSERGQGVAIAEADLGQFNTDNKVGEGDTVTNSTPIGINKNVSILGSLNDNIGVFGVNQSAGNNGNQANIVSVAAIGNNLPSF